MSDTPSLLEARPTEHKVEKDSGWLLDRETGATTQWDGIRIFWRFKVRVDRLVPDVEWLTVTDAKDTLRPRMPA